MSAQGTDRTLGMYQIGPFLGSGPIGDVFRAHQASQSNRELAVKILRPPLSNSPAIRERFYQVNGLVSRLDHPHILPLEYVGEQSGQIIAVTPFVVQGSLMGRIARGRLSPKDIAPLFKQICDALAYSHSQGLFHGNLKPTNLMLFEGRHILVGDFGQVWQMAEVDLTQTGMSPEAAYYLAPEQSEGYVDVRTDIYSLGTILYHALTGSPPFPGRTPFEVLSRHQRQPPPQLQMANPPIAPGAMVFEEVIRMALAKDPNARFQSPVAMARAIVEAGNLATDLPSRVMPVLRPGQTPLLPAPAPQQWANVQRVPGQMPPMMPAPGQTPMPPSQLMRPSPNSRPNPQPWQQPPGGQTQWAPPGVYPPQMFPPASMPPSAAQEDSLKWLLPDSQPPVINPAAAQALAEFQTARAPAIDPSASTSGTSEVDQYTGSSSTVGGGEGWWENDDDPNEDPRDFTGSSSRVRPRTWDEPARGFDESRNVPTPSGRTPSRPRAGWEASQPGYTGSSSRYPSEQPQQWNEYESREISRPIPARGRSRPYDDEPSRVRPIERDPAQSQTASRQRQGPTTSKKSSPLPAALSTLLVLVLILNALVVVVLFPSRCPGHLCDAANVRITGILGLQSSIAPLSLSGASNAAPVSVYPGASVTVANRIVVTNSSSNAQNWAISTDQPWITVSPAAGQLASGATASVNLVLTPQASTKLGDYQSQFTVKAGGNSANLTLPVKLVAPPRFAPQSTSLAVAACGQPQTDTITNTGGAPITGLVISTSDAGVTAQLDPNTNTINAGSSVTLSVTISCDAPKVGYAVYLVSSAGSLTVLASL